MAQLQLYFALLGPPEIRLGDTILTFSTRKALALLIYLAVEGGSHTRKALSELFWPELDAKHGRAALRTTLLQLRQLIEQEEEQGELSAKPHMHIDQDTLSLDLSSGIVLDVHILETAHKEVQALSRRATPVHGKKRRLLCQQLEQAIALYRGEFLASFATRDTSAFDDWEQHQRERYHQWLHQIFDTLSTLYIEGGENELALSTLTRWIAFDSLHEPAYRSLMRLYFALGNRTAALRTYETCSARLNNELQVQVMPETMALAEYIRTTVPPARMEAGLAPAMQLAIPLVGRAREFRLLIERYTLAYRPAPQGRPQVVSIEGEAGIGKTRLATEFLSWTAAKETRILQAHAFDSGERLPYQPFIELLRSGLALSHDPLARLGSVWQAELSRLLPEIRERYPDLNAPIADEMTSRPHIFEAVARFIEACTLQQPLLLFFDDIQWADIATLDLLSFLIRRWATNKTAILLLFCVNREDVIHSSPFVSWQAAVARITTLTRIPLQPLNSDDILQLLQALQHGGDEATESGQYEIPTSTDKDLNRTSRWLLHETDGYPFHLIETLKVLIEREILVLQHGQDGQRHIDFRPLLAEQEHLSQHIFPLSVYELVSTRLKPLTSTARALLVAGAVLNQQATFEHLCMVAELTPKEGLAALDEVQSASLLREAEPLGEYNTRSYYQFTHRKIREVVYAEAGRTRLRLFHMRALATLEKAGASPAELAYHATQADQQVEAFRYSLIAGDKALTIFAIQDALAYYEQAQHLLSEQSGELQRHGALSFADVQHLYARIGWVYAANKDWIKARRSFEKLLAYAQEAQETSAIWEALNLLALLHVQQAKEPQVAQKLLREALHIAQTSGDQGMMAETEWNQALLAIRKGDRASVETHVKHALEFAREQGIKEKILRCLLYLGMNALYAGSYSQAMQYAQEAFTFCDAMEYEATPIAEMQVEMPPLWSYLGLPPSQLATPRSAKLLCLLLLLLCQVQLGDPQAGEETGRAALAMSMETNDQWAQIYSMGYLACVLLEIGIYEEALSLMRRAQAMLDSSSTPLLRFFTQWISGIVHQTLLYVDEARAMLEEAAALFDTAMLSTHKALLVFPPLCTSYTLTGEREQAYHYALKAHMERERIGISSTMFDFYRDYEANALLLHSEKQAEEVVRKFVEQSGDSLRFRIVALKAQAALAQKYDDTKLAIAYLQEAAQLTEAIGLPGTRWQIQGVLGRLYQKQGEGELAAQAFALAMQTIHNIAERMQDKAIRANFLSAPQIQEILAIQEHHPDAMR